MNFLEYLQEQDSQLDEQVLTEGVHDRGIFKAVFLSGAPGSGKDSVLRRTLEGHGLTEINSDKALEYLMDREKLEKRMPKAEYDVRDALRKKAKNTTDLRRRLAVHGSNGLIINGTGDDHTKTAKLKDMLEKRGYETSMLHVHVGDETSRKRNIARGIRGGRTVPEHIRSQKWQNVQKSRAEHAKMFGDRYMEFDNDYDNQTAHPELRQQKDDHLKQIHGNIKKFVETPSKHPAALQWIAGELQKKDTLEVPKEGSHTLPHPSYHNDRKAQELGLTYYGMGRYGKGGNVTHRTVHGNLIEVPKMPEEPQQQQPKKEYVKPNKQNLTVKQKVELRNTRKLAKQKLGESYEFSDSPNFLTLGSVIQATDSPYSDFEITNSQVEQIRRNNNVKTIATESEDLVQQQTFLSETKTFGTSETTNTTNSFTKKVQEKILQEEKTSNATNITTQESIDRGIEVGAALNSYSNEYNTRSGKVTPLKDVPLKSKKKLDELTGDETTASISSQKEDELKKAGITLSTFKSKRVV